jgi:hypothetical protein
MLFPGLLHGSDGLAIGLVRNFNKNQTLYCIGQQIINYNFNQINLSNKTSFSIFEFPGSSICSKLILDGCMNSTTKQFLKLLRKHLENLETEVNYSFINGISGTLLFVLNNKDFFDKIEFSKLIKNLVVRLQYDLKLENDYVKIKNQRADNQIWDLSQENLGILIILNSLSMKNLLDNKPLFNSFINLENVLTEFWQKNFQEINKKNSWKLGRNGIIAYFLSSKNILKKLSTVQLHEIINLELYSQNFSLASGTLGNIHLKNYIDKLEGWRDENDILFKELFNINDADLFKRMLPKGLYEGLAGILFYDESLELLVPDKNWMKISSF